ncbi:WecB/TagA/CpsF family glycosyltransferase [Armatimonas sp.]|uniref:WecB/TagA/CpsF family glycosyltransferase n=1 Tax=Armatimonas sp. TaxID=1872638 RepID=UPI00286A5354|nr:WecB/TagA/CpsF family glycosyltransferase [Armatimonas sp.]
MRNTVAILGIPIDDLNTEQVMERLDEFVASQRFHQVATANTDFLIQGLDDPELKAILWTVDLVVPDGMPIVLASKWLDAPLKERVTGADLVPMLAQRAAQKGYKIFMLGGKPENAQKAKLWMEKENPGLQIVGCSSPAPSHIVTMDNEKILAEIEAAQPDILLVAFGNPKQEKWIHMHRDRLNVPVCIGVGGTFDFLAGATVRAPEWMQKSGFEWLHRLCQEPKRLWRRYMRDIVHFARFITLQLWVMRRRKRTQGKARVADITLGDCTVISLVGSLDSKQLAKFQAKAEHALNLPSHLVLDLQNTTDMDSAILGTLLNLPKRAAFVGREVRLVGVPSHLKSVLKISQAQSRLRVYQTFTDALRGQLPETLEVRTTLRGSLAALVLDGAANEENRPYLELHLRQLPNFLDHVELDMREVDFLDIGTLALLHRFAEERKKFGCDVSLMPGEAVGRLLAREKLTTAFDVVSSLSKAA